MSSLSEFIKVMSPYRLARVPAARIICLVMILVSSAGTAFGDCSAIGAIRWDAWFGDKSDTGKAVMKSLGPEKWHYRLPFCAKAVAPNAVQIECDSQAAMDQEITYAKQAGIDYWAFVAYKTDSAMSHGLSNYLASTRKSEVKFALITAAANLWKRQDYNSSIDRFVRLMHQPSYQKVAGGRPLFFMFSIEKDWIEHEWGSDAAFKAVIDEFRQRAQKEGVGNPYIVVMGDGPVRTKQLADRFGFDAISDYAAHGDAEAGTYEALTSYVKQYWDNSMATGAQVVPILMAGWDRRPRVENPVPWEAGLETNPHDAMRYYERATPKQLGQHLEDALGWVKAKPRHAQANTVIFYAWNEFDEGGWLAPTLSEGTAKLDALGLVIRRDCPAKFGAQ